MVSIDFLFEYLGTMDVGGRYMYRKKLFKTLHFTTYSKIMEIEEDVALLQFRQSVHDWKSILRQNTSFWSFSDEYRDIRVISFL